MKKVNPKNSYWITFYFTFTLEKMTKDKKKKDGTTVYIQVRF